MNSEISCRLSLKKLIVFVCFLSVIFSTGLSANDELSPKDYIRRGLKFDNNGELDKAIADYTKAIKSGKLSKENLGIAYYNRGVVYKKKKEYKKAIADYTEAVEASPAFAMCYNNRGMIFDIWEQYDKAIADYSKSIELNNDSKATEYSYNNRGFAYFNIGDLKNAEKDLRKAIKLNPNYAMPYNNLGLVYSERKNYKEAARCYKKAIELDNDKEAKLYAYDNMGLDSGAQGGLREAIEMHSKALQVDPKDASAMRNKARAHFYSGNRSKALNGMKKARAVEPYGKYTAIWSYIISGCDEKNRELLGDFSQKMKNDKWPAEAVKLLIGKSSPEKCLKAAVSKNPKEMRERQIEAYFYIGKYYQVKGDKEKAAEFFSKCINSGRDYMPEAFSAKIELNKLNGDSN